MRKVIFGCLEIIGAGVHIVLVGWGLFTWLEKGGVVPIAGIVINSLYAWYFIRQAFLREDVTHMSSTDQTIKMGKITNFTIMQIKR